MYQHPFDIKYNISLTIGEKDVSVVSRNLTSEENCVCCCYIELHLSTKLIHSHAHTDNAKFYYERKQKATPNRKQHRLLTFIFIETGRGKPIKTFKFYSIKKNPFMLDFCFLIQQDRSGQY